MTAPIPSGCYRFGRFELQPDERRLLATGTPVRVGRHAFELLIALVERSGHLVTKDQLLERIWPRLVVEENTLQAHVSALRKVLGAEAIATISGQGYRFTPEVTHVAANAAPASLATARKHNLPQQLTSFIGRERVIVELKVLLDRTRLLTLTGAGGCGKTRLAMEVAAGTKQEFADGIWLVELAALQDPGLVPKALASVLGVEEQAGKSLTQAVIESIAPKHMLVLLDNVEHLLGACALLVDSVLRACSRIVILVTGRERLGIAGELAYRVPSLSVPDPAKDTTPEQVLAHESARLFVERALLQRQHFAVTLDNAAALASICQRLDGIPLAIELAAPRVRSMSVDEVSRRLDHRFGLLTGGSRTAMPRHRTLRSLIDWSYDLLSDPEKAMLERVSVFSGGWTLEAAEQVCAADGIAATDVLDLLTSLSDKNLIVVVDHRAATRYGLLETIRHYAAARLTDNGVESLFQARHLVHCLTIAEAAESQVLSGTEQVWFEQLESNHDNMRAALARCAAATGDAPRGLRLAGAIWRFWYVRGHLLEGRRSLSSLLAISPQDQDAAARAKALRGAGVLAYRMSDYASAGAALEEGLAIHRELGDRQGIVRSLNNLGLVAQGTGAPSLARALYEEALEIQRALGDRSGIAILLNNLGIVASEDADFTYARARFEESLAIHRELGERWHFSTVLGNLGAAVWHQGDGAAARPLLEQGLAVKRELGDTFGIAVILTTLAKLVHGLGEHRDACALLSESLLVHQDQSSPRDVAETLEASAAMARAFAGPLRAARLFGSADRMRTETQASLPPSQRVFHERETAAARKALGDDLAFDAAWREGQAMTREDALREALDVLQVGTA